MPVPTPPNSARPANRRPGNTKSTATTVWVLGSYRAGENAQLLGLAQALKARCTVQARWLHPHYRPGAALLGLARMVSRRGVDILAPEFAPPWPALVVSAGLKNEPIARWIKQASGGRTKIVFLGRTWAAIEHFDLIITTPQYRLPPAANVLHNRFTLHSVTPEALAAAQHRWAHTFEPLPAPRTGLLVGGSSGDFSIDANSMRALCAQLPTHGAVLATTSARTSPAAAATLRTFATATGRRCFHHQWQHDQKDETNPYLGILAWADELIVTADSVAMLSEAIATGKPVAVFDPRAATTSVPARVYRFGMRVAPRRLTRDVDIVLETAYATGQVTRLGDATGRQTAGSNAQGDIDAAVARIETLLDT